MRNKINLCIAIALFFFQGALANRYYVSPTGNDISGDGSSGNPWKTLKYAVTRVAANQGHTIQLTAGTFIESGPVEIPSGVSIEGAGRDLTILKAASSFYYHPASPGYATDKFLVSLKAASPIDGNQSLKSFTIDGDQKQLHGGIFVQYRNNVLIDGVKVQNTNFTGIWLWDVKDSKIANTVLVNCSWGSTGYCSGALNLGNVERVEIDQLNVNESVGYGIKAIGPSGGNNIIDLKIHDTRVSVNPYGLWNNGGAPNIAIELFEDNLKGCEIYNSYVDNTISVVTNNLAPATGIQTIRIHHNTIDMETRAKGEGYGVELTMNDAEIDHNYFIKGRYGIANWVRAMKNWNIHHNVFYALGGVYPGDIVRSQLNGLHNVNFYNNTIEFAGDKTMNVVGVYGGTSENVNLVNNLFINNNTAYSYYPNSLIHTENGAVLSNLVVKNNMFDKLPIGNVAGSYSGNLTGDPKISRSGARPDPYYNPVAGSPLIDKGLNVALSFLGLAPDIGAYEFISALINLKPQIALTTPANNATFAPGTTVSISANASDTDGSITKVEFFLGATRLAEDFNSPYTYAWSNVPAGSYSLTAKATDNLGATTTSGAINITVRNPNQAPVVSIVNPKDNAKFKTGSTVSISASAADPDGTVTKVEFFNGTSKLGEDLTDPYLFDWSDVPAGSYSLTVKATDNSGATTVSSPVNILVRDIVKVGLYAPDAALQGNMKLTSDGTTSKGSYFSMPVGSGTNFSIPPPSSAQFNFELAKTDTYVAWVRLRSPSENSQGYHIYDGKGHWTSWLSGIHPEWTWVKVTDAYTNQVATFPYTAGLNVFRMAWFQENVQVDRILITNDPDFIPTDQSEMASDPPVKIGLYAPDAGLVGQMKLTTDPTASKGSYFSMPVGSGTNFYIPPPSSAQFNFELAKTDTYVAWVRLRSPSENSQGYHIYDGKGHWTSWLAGIHPDWTWVKVTDAYTNQVATFPYTAGLNVFRMAWFQENVQVDRILITNDPDFVPTDQSEMASDPPVKIGLYAPDAGLVGQMKLTTDPTASKGSYFSMPVGSGTNFYIPPPSSAQFNFELAKTDTYVAWVRLRSPSENSQGYHIYDGKGHWTSWLAGIHPEWTWVKVTDAYTNQVATFPYTAGLNVFRMAWFQENVQVDRILITNDPDFIPSEEKQISDARSLAPTQQPLDEIERGPEISVFPNPVKDKLMITYRSATAQQASINIQSTGSLTGQALMVPLQKGLNNITVSTDSLERGVYVVTIQTPDGEKSLAKIVVAK